MANRKSAAGHQGHVRRRSCVAEEDGLDQVDHIVVLDHGKILEQGTHRRLRHATDLPADVGKRTLAAAAARIAEDDGSPAWCRTGLRPAHFPGRTTS